MRTIPQVEPYKPFFILYQEVKTFLMWICMSQTFRSQYPTLSFRNVDFMKKNVRTSSSILICLLHLSACATCSFLVIPTHIRSHSWRDLSSDKIKMLRTNFNHPYPPNLTSLPWDFDLNSLYMVFSVSWPVIRLIVLPLAIFFLMHELDNDYTRAGKY